jgi:glycosyltransferase involved in cell wall biosynthesis
MRLWRPGDWFPVSMPAPCFTLKSPGRMTRFLCRSVLASIPLLKVIRKVRPDIIHANGRGAWIPSRLCSLAAGVPLIWHARDLAGSIAFDRIAGRLSTRCLAPSLALARRVHGVVVPNGVDTECFQPGDRRRARASFPGLPPDRTIAGMISQWVSWKRVDLFLNLAERICSEDPSIFFVLCGAQPPGDGGCLRKRYEAALCGRGMVMSWTENVSELMRALDMLVHPAAAEAFGRTPVEAMACGIPVIGANLGGVAETVVDGVTGILCSPGDLDAFKDGILRLARDPGLARSMGKNGRARVESLYSASHHARLVEAQYRLVLG